MSIYPVRLAEWYPPNPQKYTTWAEMKQQKHCNAIARICVQMSKCCVCGKKPKYRNAWGLHSIPWGHGWEKVWCSEQCLEANLT